MSPPVAQALTVHWADVPRGLVVCAATTFRQRLTGEVSWTVLAWRCGCRCFSARLGVGVGLGDVVGVSVALGEPVGLAEGEPLAGGEDFRVLVGVTDGEAVLVDEAVSVGEAVPDVLARADAEPLVAGGELGEGDAECVSVLVGDGEGLGWVPGSRTCSQDVVAAVVRPAAVAVPAAAATLTPVAAVTRTPPATRATVAGRACAKRMRTPYQVLLVTALERLLQYGFVTRNLPAWPDSPPIGPQTPRERHCCPTRMLAMITVSPCEYSLCPVVSSS
jgi:hypothetical protein